jgi:hypothetical protein
VTDAESTPITGIGELTTNDADDGTYAALNNAALVISGTGWRGPDRPRGLRPGRTPPPPGGGGCSRVDWSAQCDGHAQA